MNNKFNILWLDDEFINEEGSVNLPLPLIRMRFPTLDIETVAFVDHCEEKLKSKDKSYQAVILDANGKYSNTPNQEANKIGFEDLIDLAQNLQIPVYVFSGELSPEKAGDQADVTLHNLMRKGFKENVNLFYKGMGYSDFLKSVLEDLNNDYQILYKYPDILDNVLNYNIDKNIVSNLLCWLETKEDGKFPGYLPLRCIVVDFVWNKVFRPFIGSTKADPDYNKITDYCMEQWEIESLKAFKGLTNKGVHDFADSNYMREIVANAFVIIMKWYNKFMHRKQENSNPLDYYSSSIVKSSSEEEGIVEVDRNGLYIIGSYLMKPSDGEKYSGKRVKVVRSNRIKQKLIATKVDPVYDSQEYKPKSSEF